MRLHLAAVSKIDRWVEDDLVTRLDSVTDVDRGPEIARDRDFAEMRRAVFQNGNAESVSIEDDGLGRNNQRWYLPRDMQLDRAIDTR